MPTAIEDINQKKLQEHYGNLMHFIDKNCMHTKDAQKAVKMIKKSYNLLKVKK